MRIALLSCGESLTRYPGLAGYGAIIGVNKAATAFPVDFWSVGDSETFFRYRDQIAEPPTVWTHHESHRRIVRRQGWISARTYERDERHNRWSMFSATAALWLARELGAEVVECFGCDMRGILSFDGTQEPMANRTPARWQLERGIWDQTVKRLASEGVEVVRNS